MHSSDVNDTGRRFFQNNMYLLGYPYPLSTHPNGFAPVSLKSSH